MSETLTSREAAAELGVPLSTFHSWVVKGDITHVKRLPGLRGAKLFTVEDVAALKASKAKPQPVAS